MKQHTKQHFDKLIFGTPRCVPRNEIYVYYEGIPLYKPAKFRGDRYSFPLPVNLEEKMIAGYLIADFCYSELPADDNARKPSDSPVSIILSDRYA